MNNGWRCALEAVRRITSQDENYFSIAPKWKFVYWTAPQHQSEPEVNWLKKKNCSG